MEQKLEEASQCKRKLQLIIPQDQAKDDYYSIVKKYRKHVNIDGFRKGKAPLSTIENLLKDKLIIGFIEEFAPKYYKKAINNLEEKDVMPVNKGQLVDYDWVEGNDLILNFMFEVAPDIALDEYKNFEVEYEPQAVTDEMVDQKLEELQEQYSTNSEKDDAIQAGDQVYYTITKLNGKEVNKKEENGYKVGQNKFGEKFDNDLIGAKKNDTIASELQFKTEDKDGNKPQKSIQIQINSVKVIEEPALDDEFAKDVGEYENLAELKQDINKELAEDLDEKNESTKHATVLQAIIKKNPFEVPASLVENYVNSMVKQSGQSDKLGEQEMEQFKNMYRSYAEKEIQTYYVMEALRELEDVEVSPEEVAAQIKRDAKSVHMDVEKYEKMYGKNIDTEKIKIKIKDKKILDKISETIKFKKPKKEKKSKDKKKE